MENGRHLTPEEDVKATQLIALLELHKEISDFLQPVDYVSLQIPDYPRIIKNPMDIGTIKKNLKAHNYTSLERILSDIQLVWDNCKTFNDPITVNFYLGNLSNVGIPRKTDETVLSQAKTHP